MSLTIRCFSKYQKPLQVLSSLLFIHAFTWIELSKISLKHKNYNHCCDLLGSLTIFFSFGSWKGRIEKVYVEIYNFTPNLRFTYDSSEKSMSFLDLIITVSERKLKTTLHRKSADCYECLHYASSHPEHTKHSVVFSQTLRVSRLCSEENDFKNYRSQMK